MRTVVRLLHTFCITAQCCPPIDFYIICFLNYVFVIFVQQANRNKCAALQMSDWTSWLNKYNRSEQKQGPDCGGPSLVCVLNIELANFYTVIIYSPYRPTLPLRVPKISISSSLLVLAHFSCSCLDAGVGGVARRQISSILSRSGE